MRPDARGRRRGLVAGWHVLIPRMLVGLAGGGVIILTLLSAVETVVLPRGESTRLSRVLFVGLRVLFNARMRFMREFEDRDRFFALFAPIGLLLMPLVWLIGVGLGYAAVFWTLEHPPWSVALRQSGSSLFTLGNTPVHGWAATLCSYSEAGLGLGLLALLIAYLPTMYSSFQRREQVVTLLEVRANTPPTAERMLVRYRQ